jgi:hypothetical protein
MNISSGPITRPVKFLLYGVEGIGKTTLISQLAGHRILFLDTESGTLDVNLERVSIDSKARFDAVVKWLLTEQHDFDTAVVDTVTGLEPMIEATILKAKKKSAMADFEYGKGSVYLREEFDSILYLQLDELLRRGINVALIGHSRVNRFQDPSQLEGWDRYELAMDKRVAETLRQWADHVLFCNWDHQVTDNERGESRGIGGTRRQLFTTHTAAYDAKNRAGLPAKLEWKPESIAPLFSGAPRPAAEPEPADNGNQAHREAFKNLLQVIKADQWSPEDLNAFFKSRFPAFELSGNVDAVPLEYIKRAINHPQAFIVTINEFIAAANDHGATAQTQPA